MNLQILSRPLAGDPRFAEHAAIARDQIERLEKMLTDLLDFGRPLSLRPERVDLGDCIRKAVEDVRARADGHGASIDINGSRGIMLQADPARIAQALVNLLANAIDASAPGGRIEVAASEVRERGARRVLCEVRDQGAGIRPEHREAVFDPFFSTKEGGTGLGLAMVRKIAALHGGRVELESEVDRGTVARMVLPGDGAA
jgi:two-component system sensor histidine kinase HydH